jgi:hypothetical protein
VTGDGFEIRVVGDGELAALGRLGDYHRAASGALERQEGQTRLILISRSHALDLQRRSGQLRAETEALLAGR